MIYVFIYLIIYSISIYDRVHFICVGCMLGSEKWLDFKTHENFDFCILTLHYWENKKLRTIWFHSYVGYKTESNKGTSNKNKQKPKDIDDITVVTRRKEVGEL